MSPKQIIYSQLIHHGFVMLRVYQSWAAYGSWWSRLFRYPRKHFQHGHALADLLHNIHRSILVPEFTDNDFGFINHAIPTFLRRAGSEVEVRLASFLVQFHDAVPSEQRDQLTWHPSEELRKKARVVEDQSDTT